jgi:hypothetical protein
MQLVDAVHGIEWRGVEDPAQRGWRAQWRPLRAMKAFPGFSFMSLSKVFPSERDAVDYIRENVESILAGGD